MRISIKYSKLMFAVVSIAVAKNASKIFM